MTILMGILAFGMVSAESQGEFWTFFSLVLLAAIWSVVM